MVDRVLAVGLWEHKKRPFGCQVLLAMTRESHILHKLHRGFCSFRRMELVYHTISFELPLHVIIQWNKLHIAKLLTYLDSSNIFLGGSLFALIRRSPHTAGQEVDECECIGKVLALVLYILSFATELIRVITRAAAKSKYSIHRVELWIQHFSRPLAKLPLCLCCYGTFCSVVLLWMLTVRDGRNNISES